MSDKKWISMRDAVIRHHGPEDRRLDQEIFNQFLYSVITEQIQVRGLLTKICINESEGFIPEDNREYVIQRLNEDRSFKVNSEIVQSDAHYPFIIGKARETSITIIPPSFWQNHGQIWQQNKLVGFECALPEDHTEKLRPSFEISSSLAALGLESSEYMQTHDMPEIYIYEQVEVQVEADIIKLQSGSANVKMDDNDIADRQANKKGRGANKDERWPDIISIVENIILSEENFSTQKVLCNKVFDELNKQYTEWNKKNPEKKYKIKGPMTPYGLLDGLRKYDLEIYTQIKKQIGQKSK